MLFAWRSVEIESGTKPAFISGTAVDNCAGVLVRPGDIIVADEDGVVVVPQAIAEEVLVEAELKAATESEIRVAVRDGMLPLDAYERYGTF